LSDPKENDDKKEKEKERFVQDMMELANKSKPVSEEEIYAKLNKDMRRREYYEWLFYAIFFILTIIIIYFNVK
jgi:hypothetical protein